MNKSNPSLSSAPSPAASSAASSLRLFPQARSCPTRGNRACNSSSLGTRFPLPIPFTWVSNYMADRLKELSGGTMEIILFPSEQMGDETKCIEQVQMGTLASPRPAPLPWATLSRSQGFQPALPLPMMLIHYWRVLEGEIGKEMLIALANATMAAPPDSSVWATWTPAVAISTPPPPSTPRQTCSW
jgi:TRAP-type C4-dicarboxylate transport system substrate-binding protein